MTLVRGEMSRVRASYTTTMPAICTSTSLPTLVLASTLAANVSTTSAPLCYFVPIANSPNTSPILASSSSASSE